MFNRTGINQDTNAFFNGITQSSSLTTSISYNAETFSLDLTDENNNIIKSVELKDVKNIYNKNQELEQRIIKMEAYLDILKKTYEIILM